MPGTGVLAAAAVRLGADWRQWALAGGEDHAFAATFPARSGVPAGWTVIGHAEQGEAGVLVDGQRWLVTGGWDHFAKPGR
jgi:thiamine-monophosphate kinase